MFYPFCISTKDLQRGGRRQVIGFVREMPLFKVVARAYLKEIRKDKKQLL